MIRAILFDLDGTLLPIDTDALARAYLKRISEYFSHRVDPDKMIKALWDSTLLMIQNTESHRTNRDVFEADFYPRLGLDKEELLPELDRFYMEEFPKLKAFARVYAFVPDLVHRLKEQGFKLALATNPLFPRVAIEERIRWTGLKPDDFDWVASYEECHFCKPNPHFYLEVAERLNVKPQECLMVGNDVQEDLIAQKVGMKTFLVKDYRIDRGEPQFEPDDEGTMEEFYQRVLEGRLLAG